MTDLTAHPLFLYGIAGAVLIVVILAAFLYLRSRRQAAAVAAEESAERTGRLAYQPDIRPISEVRQAAIPKPARKTPSLPQPKKTDLLSGMSDIGQSLHALVDKYSLDQFTIATSDGLVFASGGDGAAAQADAARYSGIYCNNPLAETPGVVLAKVSHKGSDLILIIRTSAAVPDPIRAGIENDTKDILNRWI